MYSVITRSVRLLTLNANLSLISKFVLQEAYEGLSEIRIEYRQVHFRFGCRIFDSNHEA